MKIEIHNIYLEHGNEYDLPVKSILAVDFYSVGGKRKALLICERGFKLKDGKLFKQ